MTTAYDLLKDTSVLNYKKVYQIPKDQLFLLAQHSDYLVRTTAIEECPESHLPLFCNESHPMAITAIAKRLM
jgi:hypothetical protein